MRTIQINKCRFLMILVFLLLVMARHSGFSQNVLHTPYPIIFVHGLAGDNTTWRKEDVFDITDFLESGETPLNYGGVLNITLDYDRNPIHLNNSKEEDVHLFSNSNLIKGDFYVVNFNVHALGGIAGKKRTICIDAMLTPTLKNILVDEQIFHVGDIIRVDNEFMLVESTNGFVITVQRGILNSIAASHYFARDKEVYAWNLSNESNIASITKQGYGLKLAIDFVKAKTGANKVILLGHSMGGLAAREYIRSNIKDRNDVAKIITIGTPHYGSNLTAFPTLPEKYFVELDDWMKLNLDLKSDAQRDLKTGGDDILSNIFYGKLGTFLFGGNENLSSKNYYSKDVNSDGDETDAIIGLNSQTETLESISKTWIVSSFKETSSLPDFLLSENDGVVLTKSQYLYKEDTLRTNRPHISIADKPGEASDIYSLIRGLDEPSTADLAYEIGENSTNKGFITYGIYNNPVDVDMYKINLKEAGLLKINILGNSYTGITNVNLIDEKTDECVQSISGISKTIEYQVPAPGAYYIQISGIAAGGTYASYLYPYTLNTQFVATPTATMSVSPGSLQYYDVVINAPKEKTFKLTNNGATNILITSIDLSDTNADQFTVSPMPPFAVTQESSQNLTVTFNPTSIGTKVANLEITTNSPDIPKKTVSLQGNGTNHETKVLVCSQTTPYIFENTKINTNRSKTFTIQNTGSNAVTISYLAFEGLNPDPYSIISPLVIPFEIGSGITKQITVKFSPTSLGSKSATLSITNNSDNLSPKYSIELIGNGTENYYIGSSNSLIALEYWFDNQYQAKVNTPATSLFGSNLGAEIPTNSLISGLHSIQLRYKDKNGKWSSVVSEFFHKLPVTPAGSPKITASEYWFDNDFDNKVTTPVTPSQTITINSGFEVSSLSSGLHTYHVRYMDDAGQWSSVVSEFFNKMPIAAAGSHKITACEYWFDDAYATKVSTPITPSQTINVNSGFDISLLSIGLHSYNVRYQDDGGQWSSVTSEFIHKSPLSAEGSRKITAYEYWFDDDFVNKVSTPVTPNQNITINNGINVDGLQNGLHSYHVIYKDDAGQWSSVVSEFFQKLPASAAGSRKITTYEYWFDNDFTNKVSTLVTPGQSITVNGGFDVGSLSIGLHSYNVRYKDDAGQWSSVTSEFIHKSPLSAEGSRKITAYEYWFDDDFTNKVSTPVTPNQTIMINNGFNVDGLQNGLHSYHVIYKDDAGQWSSVVSEFFQKLPASAAGLRKITAYEYWFDNDFTNKVSTSVTPSQTITVNGGFDVGSLSIGLHSYNVRYKDDGGQWSSVTSEFIHTSPVSTTGSRQITAYEYWFDNDYASKVSNAVTTGQTFSGVNSIDATTLPIGLHNYHFRYKDDDGQWSSVVSEFFHKLGMGTLQSNLITAYRYWFNRAESAMITVNLPAPVNPYELIKSINTSALPVGDNTIHFQFKDTYQAWSSVLTDTIVKSTPNTIIITESGPTTFCEGNSVILTTSAAITYLWSNGATTQSITVSTSGNYSVTVNNGSGSNLTSDIVSVTVNTLPSEAGTITGNVTVCKAGTETYTVPTIAGATSYIWTLPAGLTGTSTSKSITVTIGNTAISGIIKVKGHSDCGDGTENTLAITVNDVPVAAGVISGNTNTYKGTTETYTVPVITGSTSYIWTLPTGVTGTSTTNSIVATISNSGVSGNIKVKGRNSCGDGTESTLAITINDVPVAGTITGNSKVCKGTTETYTVMPIAGATSYIWTLPTGVTGTSSANSIIVTIGSSATIGSIKVKGHNNSGDGTESTLVLTVNDVPVAASAITGNTIVCQGVTETYTVPVIAGTDSYIWSLPTGLTGISTTNSITVTIGNTALAGVIKVKGHNDCGDGTDNTLTITVNGVPVAAGIISGNTSTYKGTTETYTVPAITDATSYIWTLPTGVTGTSTTSSIVVTISNSAVSGNIKVKGRNGCGDGTESALAVTINDVPVSGTIVGNSTVCKGTTETYTVMSIVGATSYIWTLPTGVTGTSSTNSIIVSIGSSATIGSIKVKGHNNSGDGTESILAITINDVPPVTGTITGNTFVCKVTTETYTVPVIVGNTSYIWTLPTGITGTSITNSITVTIGNSATSGSIKVKGHNGCGDGTENTLAITVNDLPSTAGALSGNTLVCKGGSESYTVPAIIGATSYIWTLPTGITGTSSTNSITVSIGNTATSGSIKVKGRNSCEDGTESSLAITVNDLPSAAGALSGNTSVCNGGTGSYTIPAIIGATSYIWTLPTGITGTSTTNSITATIGNNATSGSIKVKGHNGCGDGTESILAITVNNMPSATGLITGNNSVCKGVTETYSVPAIVGAISYIWTLPTGATGTSSTNTISVTFSNAAISGTVKVKGHNDCGDGTESSLAVTVNAFPLSAGVITGSTNICLETTNIIYSIPAIIGATSYIWTLPTGVTGTSTTNTISLTYNRNSSSGNLKVKGHNDCGDGVESSLAITVCLGVGIEDATLTNKVEVYPNPSHDVFYVTINKPFKNDFKVEVCNNFGQVIQTILKNKGDNKFSVELTNYPTGLYFVRFSDNETYFHCKIVKQ